MSVLSGFANRHTAKIYNQFLLFYFQSIRNFMRHVKTFLFNVNSEEIHSFSEGIIVFQMVKFILLNVENLNFEATM